MTDTNETPKTNSHAPLSGVMLPCPFCGGEAEVLASWLNSCNNKKYHWFYPSCKGEIRENCPAIVEEQDEQGGCCCDCRSVEEAVELWNKRA